MDIEKTHSSHYLYTILLISGTGEENFNTSIAYGVLGGVFSFKGLINSVWNNYQ